MKRRVYTGIDNIESYAHLMTGRKIGLITNLSARARDGRTTVDIISSLYDLCALFAPEHGFEAKLAAGEIFENNSINNLRIYSLYGEYREPSDEMLSGIDVMIYDIQDVGIRHYTYLSTLTRSMSACAKKGIPFLVLDRPNPLGRKVSGEMLEDGFRSFVGEYPVPTRYGLTVGEYASYINDRYSLGCKLEIAMMTGYSGNIYFDECDLKWYPPSPNLPDTDCLLPYLTDCFLEATNISEGRGTNRPFKMLGAPFIDSVELCRTLNGENLPGVVFEEAEFTPNTSKFAGMRCHGADMIITDRDAFDAYRAKLVLFGTLRRHYGDKLEINEGFFALLAGNKDMLSSYDVEALCEKERESSALFSKLTEKYRIYN